MRTAVTERLGIATPIVQAPMGGGPGTVELAAAASNAGALGSLAGGYLTADDLRVHLQALRTATDNPFAVNIFVPERIRVDPTTVASVQDVLEPYRVELGLPARTEPPPVQDAFAAQIDVLLDAPSPVVSFTFGLPPADVASRLHDAGCILIATVTTVREAVAAVDAGMDLVCAQGSEAGAHRGTFLDDPSEAVIGTVALVPQVCDAVTVPVIAAGGIMDGRGVAAVLALGAGAAQLGTAFLRCPEAGTPAAHRRALMSAR
ncbi:MAG: nitronate monooxygenase, partial [Trueperaceae bacterium]